MRPLWVALLRGLLAGAGFVLGIALALEIGEVVAGW